MLSPEVEINGIKAIFRWKSGLQERVQEGATEMNGHS